jgi:trimethylamine:corrinoid methyltransferase-like protein
LRRPSGAAVARERALHILEDYAPAPLAEDVLDGLWRIVNGADRELRD